MKLSRAFPLIAIAVALAAGPLAHAQEPTAPAPTGSPAPLPPGLPSVTGAADPNASPLDTKAAEERAADDLKLMGTEEPEYRLSMESKTRRMTMTFLGQFSSFERQGEQLVGYALEVQAGYAMTNKIALQMALNQALTFDGAISLLYTGIRTSTAYAIDGDFMNTSAVLEVNDLKTISFRSVDKPLLAVDGGLDQYFFNGVSRIVPATGISASVRYERTLWDLRATLSARYGLLVISEVQAPMLSLGAGMSFAF